MYYGKIHKDTSIVIRISSDDKKQIEDSVEKYDSTIYWRKISVSSFILKCVFDVIRDQKESILGHHDSEGVLFYSFR